MIKAALLIFFIFFVTSKSFSCDGALKGTATIEMKEDRSICITIVPKGQQSESRCFEKGSKEYKEIINEFKEIKPGNIIVINENGC
jgi:hypothetical protein